MPYKKIKKTSKKQDRSNLPNWAKLLISLIVPFLAGFIGSSVTITGINSWYMNIAKPSFNPPNWIFGPVWTVLYIMMGFALYFLWTAKTSENRKKAITFFTIQIFLNSLWSILFFALEAPLLAFIEIIILWVFILLTIFYSWKVSRKAAYLLIPYILWVSFAAVLNFAIFLLN